MAKEFSYGKREKLKSRKLTEQLFSTGKTFTVFPLKVFFQPVADEIDFPLKVGVGVSRRHFKKATDRNRVKRLLRETYRTEKKLLLEYVKTTQQQLAVFFLYVDKTLPDYTLLKSKMPIVMERLVKQLHEKAAANT